MNSKIRYLLLAPFLLSSVVGCGSKGSGGAPSGGSPVDVVIISGQSNGVGCTKSIYLADSMGEEKYNEYFDGYPNIQIAYDCWTKDWPATGITFYSQNTSRKNNFVKTTLGQGNGFETFGPEIGIAESTHEKHGDKLFLIKYACGGSNLKDDWLGKNSPMYGRMIDYVKLQIEHLKEKGYSPTIKAFCWMQGEGDSYPNYYNVYQENLRTFVSDIRRDFRELAGGKDLPFIDAGISENQTWMYPRQVNDAKKAFAEESENNIFIDTMAAGLHTNREPTTAVDLAHYDSESEIMLGRLFAEAFEQFLDKN